MLEFNSEQKEYTTTTLLNDENKRFELKTVCQFYQEQIEQCKVLCKQKIRNSFLNPVFSIYTKYFNKNRNNGTRLLGMITSFE